MAKFNTTIVTDAGKELFAKVRAGKEQLTWTKAQMYYANDADKISNEAFKKATPGTFGDAIKKTNVGVVDIKGTTVTISSSFLNQNQLSDLNFNLVGWFANSSLDQEEKLVAITPSVGDQVLTAGATDGKATASIDLVLAIDVGDANIVKITPIEEGLIDHTELKNALALLASKGLINTGNDITSSQNINLDEHFNTSLQYIDEALNNITSIFGSNFSGKGWLMSFGNHENKNNQNNVQLLFDTNYKNRDGQIESQILFRYFYADYNMWTSWDSLITANNINSFLPSNFSWLDVDNNKPKVANYIHYGSYGAGMFLPPFLNKLTYSANDENELKKDNVIADLDTLLINHAQLMQELGNYYTKKDIDAQNFVKTVDGNKPDEKGNVKSDGSFIANIYNEDNAKKYFIQPFSVINIKSGYYMISSNVKLAEGVFPDGLLTDGIGFILRVVQTALNQRLLVAYKYKNDIKYVGSIYATIVTTDAPKSDRWTEFSSVDNLVTKTDALKFVSKDDVYDKKTIDKLIANAGQVKTVNNVKPDNKGNVQIKIPDSYTKQESDNQFETKQDLKTKLVTKNDKITHAMLQHVEGSATFETAGDFSNTADLGDISTINNTIYFDPKQFIDGLSSDTLENPLISKDNLYQKIQINTLDELKKIMSSSGYLKPGIYEIDGNLAPELSFPKVVTDISKNSACILRVVWNNVGVNYFLFDRIDVGTMYAGYKAFSNTIWDWFKYSGTRVE